MQDVVTVRTVINKKKKQKFPQLFSTILKLFSLFYVLDNILLAILVLWDGMLWRLLTSFQCFEGPSATACGDTHMTAHPLPQFSYPHHRSNASSLYSSRCSAPAKRPFSTAPAAGLIQQATPTKSAGQPTLPLVSWQIW
jgi:hypothetical protein